MLKFWVNNLSIILTHAPFVPLFFVVYSISLILGTCYRTMCDGWEGKDFF